MEPARNAARGFFPLDEELDLDDSDLTPRAQEGLVRLATWVPFGPAAQLLRALLGVQVSKASARRFTLQAGEAALQEWEQQTEELQRLLPEPLAGAPKQVMSADGAMVPLRGGVWAEVKTLVLGEVCPTEAEEVQIQALSYCSRLTDVPGFEAATLLETHRRGLERADSVAAVTDGAEWLQGFIDYQRADAVRILDFAHAAEYVSAIGQAVRAGGHHLPAKWLEGVLHRLKHQGPERILLHLRRLAKRCTDPEVSKNLQYLEERTAQMQYPTYRAAGWPIGSGMVESANKLVVEVRLKGAGMHWKRENVNPMLLLRNAVCNDRWDETWQGRMQQEHQRRQRAREKHAQVRMEQAAARFLRLLLLIPLPRPHPREEAFPAATTPPLTAPAAVSLAPLWTHGGAETLGAATGFSTGSSSPSCVCKTMNRTRIELGWVVGVAVGRGSGLKGAAEAVEAGSSSPDIASASSVTPASCTPPERSHPSRKHAAGAHRVNRLITGSFCSLQSRKSRPASCTLHPSLVSLF